MRDITRKWLEILSAMLAISATIDAVRVLYASLTGPVLMGYNPFEAEVIKLLFYLDLKVSCLLVFGLIAVITVLLRASNRR